MPTDVSLSDALTSDRCKVSIEYLDITALTRYDRRSKCKKYKYLWQRNDTLNIRSQIFSLTYNETSGEWSFVENFESANITDSNILNRNLSLDIRLNILLRMSSKVFICQMYLYFVCLDRLSHRVNEVRSRCSIGWALGKSAYWKSDIIQWEKFCDKF